MPCKFPEPILLLSVVNGPELYPEKENQMATKVEDAIASLKAQEFNTPAVLQVLDLITEQNERIKNLEAGTLTVRHALSVLDTTSVAHGASIGSLAQDRDTHAARIAEFGAKPAADSKKIEELDKRVTTVEGAVGSKMWKRAETPKPVMPLAAEPVAPKPGIFSGLTGTPTPPPGTP
jgi:hypothetical protein